MKIINTRRKFLKTATMAVVTGCMSAMDNALWDLRGKAMGQPVWQMLGAKRNKLNAYASMLGFGHTG